MLYIIVAIVAFIAGMSAGVTLLKIALSGNEKCSNWIGRHW